MDTALLTEHLRFTPLTLLDDIINTVNEVVTRAVDAAESGLLSTDPVNLGFDKRYQKEGRTADSGEDGGPVYPEAKGEIEEGLHKLETLLESNVDRNFDKFEIYVLRGVLSVPQDLAPWVKLGHYEGVDFAPKGEAKPSAEEVAALRYKLKQTRKLNCLMERELRNNDAALEQLQRFVQTAPSEIKSEHAESGRDGMFAMLTNGEAAKKLGVSTRHAMAGADGALVTNTSFALSQLPALRALLDELRPKVAELGNAEVAADESHAARERRIYLNSQTRRAIERQGVEITGSAEALSRRVPGDELAALEGIAASLGASRQSDDHMTD